MNDVLVSVRIPSSLSEALRKTAEQDHYMDVSELVRSIARERWLASKDPFTYEIAKLREDIKNELTEKVERLTKQRVVKELKDIQEGMKRE